MLVLIISNVKHFCAVLDEGVAVKCSYPSADTSETLCDRVSAQITSLTKETQQVLSPKKLLSNLRTT